MRRRSSLACSVSLYVPIPPRFFLDVRQYFGAALCGKSAVLGQNQPGANGLNFTSLADQIIDHLAFAGEFLALDLRFEPGIIGRCQRNTLSGHGAFSIKNSMVQYYTIIAPMPRTS